MSQNEDQEYTLKENVLIRTKNVNLKYFQIFSVELISK